MAAPALRLAPSPDDWLAQPLPLLRDDLKLFPGPSEADGSPTWTVYDPVRHRYFRFGRAGFEFMARWTSPSGAALLDAIAGETTLETSADELEQFIRFLRGNTLLRADTPDAVRTLTAVGLQAKPSWASWLLHNYLFMRFPLFRPDRFLAATLPAARLLLNRRFVAVVLALGAIGLLLTLRQWDQFAHTFQHFFSLEGAAAFGVTLVAVKICHELGHAYTARKFGCRVPTMGVALMVLMPVLYTDVSDAWRLVSRRQRLLIGASGVLTELGLALIATFLWSFLPDGPARSAAFLVATTTWITSVAINASPFMRFDGYYVLSDWLAVSNLQPRSFALARWHLRRTLFGFDDPPPEVFPRRQRLILLAYAWATWIYRLALFLGIALLVYHFFIKVLGIFLFAVEMGWFVLRPFVAEAAEWGKRRGQFRLNRNLVLTLAVVVGVILLVAIPWHSRVTVPAVLRAADYATLFPPVPARIQAMDATPRRVVAAGDVLYRLEAPELEFQLRSALQKQQLLELQIERQAGGADDLANLHVLRQQLASTLTTRAGLLARQERLILRAPLAGLLTDVPPELHSGMWVKADQPLGTVVGTVSEVRGYVAAPDLERLAVSARGVFIPEDPARSSVAVEITEIAHVNVAVLDTPMLASTQGGPIAVQQAGKGVLVPATTVYRVTLRLQDGETAPAQVIPGIVLVEGEAQSVIARAARAIAAVLIRESGF